MAYAGYAPTKYAAEKTPLDKVLAVVQEPASLTMLGTLTRNVAQAPRDEKFRRVRLTNPKIAAALVDVNGAVDVMLHLGWIHEGEEFLVLPSTVQLTMAHARAVEAAKEALEAAAKAAAKARLAARTAAKKPLDPAKEAIRLQMEADRKERAAMEPAKDAKANALKPGAGITTASSIGIGCDSGG